MIKLCDTEGYPKSAERMLQLFLEGHKAECCRPIYDFLSEVIESLVENARGDAQEVVSEKDILNQAKMGALSDTHFYWITAVIVNTIIVPLFIVEAILKGDNDNQIINELNYTPACYSSKNTTGTKEAWDFILNYFMFSHVMSEEKTFDRVKSFFLTKDVTKDNFNIYKKSMEEWQERVNQFEKNNSELWKINYDPFTRNLVIRIFPKFELSDVRAFIVYISHYENYIRNLLRNIASHWGKLRESHNSENLDDLLPQLFLAHLLMHPDESLKDARFITTAMRMLAIADYHNKNLMETVHQATAEIQKLVKKKQGYGPGNKSPKYEVSDAEKELINKALPELQTILKKFWPIKFYNDDGDRAKAMNYCSKFNILRPEDMNFDWYYVSAIKGKIDLARRIIQLYLLRLTGKKPSLDGLEDYLNEVDTRL